METGFFGRGLVAMAVGGGMLATAYLVVPTYDFISNRLSEVFYVDPENPNGTGICYLNEKDRGLPITRADADCYRVVIDKELIAPQRF